MAIENIPGRPQTSVFNLLGESLSHKSILKRFREHIENVKEELRKSRVTASFPKDSPKIVAIFESITASPGLLLPWKEMVRICREENVWSVVDAAHSLGQEVSINLQEVNPDFWMTVSVTVL